ncbi:MULTISPECIES: TRAP transporter large permease [Prauserella salsuginis group]|uniref:Tripartite ATP-independent transporter DctM subunit n=2 Tax=Prauserella salsuginis group TaxID=2893672 RepID=A0A839Y0W9_9PSEU|nr:MULTISPECIES: TRAP transporter large permease [Prauserella salsuginis group]MBB3666333.1 tripartite ATP-independent transporter DctM subunit [Prauserella sediminis]MCR3722269.1 TRAP transporter, DctM subunit [Prauserella flava]MCR3736267.1 TRAP transporter, DctM subunit [Prauserella salsuginis]
MIDPVAVLLLFGGFAVLMLLRVPVALALAVSSIAAALWISVPLPLVGQKMVQALNSFPLLAIPFFILAGEVMAGGGVARRLIDLANVFVGWLRGGLAMLNVVASTFFGGISGSAVADTSSVGSVMLPMMREQGYPANYSVGVTVSSATQGVLIPPSHNMIIFALAAGGSVSIGGVFMAGVVPGLLIAALLLVACYVMARKQGHPKGQPIPARDVPKIVWQGLLGLLTPVIVIGGILTGVFTATESAAIACLWAVLITFGVYREVPLRAFTGMLRRSVKTLGTVLFLIAAAGAYGHLLTVLQLPEALTQALLGLSDNAVVILLLCNVLLLVLGSIMDMAPLILITTPILLPVVTSLGMDPMQFGVMLLLNLGIGLITPPVGSVLFVGSAIGGIRIEQAARGVLPFYLPMVACLLLVTFVPSLSLTLPHWLGF